MGDEDLADKSRAILSRLEGGRQYVADQGLIGEIIRKAVADFPDGNLSDEARFSLTSPSFSNCRVTSVCRRRA